MGNVLEISDQTFDQEVLKADTPVLIDFWAPWCGPCKAMAPHFEKAAGRLEPAVRLAKLNTDDEQALAGQFNIRGIPTLILFKHGREIGRQSGLMDTAGIESWVSRTLAA